MLKIILILCIIALPCTAVADDEMARFFDSVDDLIIRIESGVSLNSFAETFAGMKIDYKKALRRPREADNLLLDDRMKDLLQRLDDYAEVWKMQETDSVILTAVSPGLQSKYSISHCKTIIRDVPMFKISCIKDVVLDDIKPVLEKTKTAHYDGW